MHSSIIGITDGSGSRLHFFLRQALEESAYVIKNSENLLSDYGVNHWTVTFYLVLATGVHCADAIFHLPELCTNTTVVPSCEFSLADLV